MNLDRREEKPCGNAAYLVVVGAVGAEIRLRTKHLVHHIQAVHGEQLTKKNQASSRAAQDGRRDGIGKVQAGAQLLRALSASRTREGATPRPRLLPPHAHTPTNQEPELHLCLNGLLIRKHETNQKLELRKSFPVKV